MHAFSRNFIQISRAWRHQADLAMARLGLSYATTQPLLLLRRLGDGVRQGLLAEALGIEGPSLVRLLDQLCAAGLLERRDDPGDRRAKTIHLTGAGAALAQRAEAALDDLRSDLMRNVSDADLATSLRVLDALSAAIGRRDAAA